MEYLAWYNVYMEELYNKISELNSLVKALKSPKTLNLSPNKPSLPKPDMPAIQHEVPKAGTSSQKDPVKVAEQIKDGKIKENNIKDAKKNKGKLNMNKLGQWSLNTTPKV